MGHMAPFERESCQARLVATFLRNAMDRGGCPQSGKRGTKNHTRRPPPALPLAIVLTLLALPLWSQTSEPMRLVGVGSTFPLHTYTRWLQDFGRTRTDIHVSYLPFGSVHGAEAVAAGTADFGGTDVPLNPRSGSTRMLFFPVAVGALVPIYNLPGLRDPLRFTPQALSGIYLGTITRWNDPAIAHENPEVKLPVRDIVVIHSAAGRGSTYIWSDYLSKVSPEWKTRVGRGTAPLWPVGAAFEGNGNVAKAVMETPNSIAYVELGYASQFGLPQGLVENAAGKFVAAASETIAAAASTCEKSVMDDFRCSITNAAGKGSYPIASFTWFVISESAPSPEKRKAVKDLLCWILREGQSEAMLAGLVKVPDSVLEKELRAIDRIR
jgi:phosphate transport system substrate-binding protein